MPEGEEKEQEIGNLFEKIMKENFLNLAKEIGISVQEAQRVPNRMDAKRLTPRHIIINMPNVKDKEKSLKAVREKQLVTYMGVPIRMSADISKRLHRLGGIGKKYSVMRSRDLQPRLLYPAKIIFRIEGQIRSFPDMKS